MMKHLTAQLHVRGDWNIITPTVSHNQGKTNYKISLIQMSWFFWLIGLWSVGFFQQNACFGQQYHVDGVVLFSRYDGQENQIQQQSTKFEVEVMGCTWKITLTPTNKTVADFHQLSFDGTNLYVLHDIETAVSLLKGKGDAVAKNLATGAVLEKEVPHDMFSDGSGQVWLAYASGCYFENLKSNLVEIPYIQTGERLAAVQQTILREAKWQVRPEPPQIPARASFFSDNLNYTNAQYLVSSYTNYQNEMLPVQSTMDIFSRTKNLPGVILRWRYTITALRFKKIEKPFLWPPTVPVLTTVEDSRFNNRSDKVPTILYSIEDRFLTKDDVRKLDKFMRMKSRLRELPDQPLASSSSLNKREQWMRIAIVVTFFALTTIFLIFGIRSVRNKNKT